MARARGDDVIQIRPLIPRGRILAYLVWNYTLEYRMSEGGRGGGGGGNLLQRGATCSGVGCLGRRSTPEKIARGCSLLRSRLHGVQVTPGCTLLRDTPTNRPIFCDEVRELTSFKPRRKKSPYFSRGSRMATI